MPFIESEQGFILDLLQEGWFLVPSARVEAILSTAVRPLPKMVVRVSRGEQSLRKLE